LLAESIGGYLFPQSVAIRAAKNQIRSTRALEQFPIKRMRVERKKLQSNKELEPDLIQSDRGSKSESYLVSRWRRSGLPFFKRCE
jgi:hypothetical protein